MIIGYYIGVKKIKYPLNIILFGPQGSGKSTQGVKISKLLGIPLLVMGDLFRKEIEKGSKIGKFAKPIISKGNLMPDAITEKLLKSEIKKKRYSKGVILDGFPRNKSQAVKIKEILKIDYVIVLEILDSIVVKRISNRRGCKNGHVFSLIFNKPKKQGVCDIDGFKLVQRTDDTKEVIKNRLKIYHS